MIKTYTGKIGAAYLKEPVVKEKCLFALVFHKKLVINTIWQSHHPIETNRKTGNTTSSTNTIRILT